MKKTSILFFIAAFIVAAVSIAVAAGKIPRGTVNFVSDGDSITQRAGAWPYTLILDGSNNTNYFGIFDVAVSGSTLPDLIARASALDALLSTTKTNKLGILIGANDYLFGTSSADFLSSLAGYLDARRTAGWKVLIFTLLPNTRTGVGGITFNQWRGQINPTILTWTGVHANAVYNAGGNATMGPDAAASDVTLYLSGLHPTDPLGYGYLYADIIAAVAAMN